MKVLDPGHWYLLNELDYNGRGESFLTVQFVKREGLNYPGNSGHYSGTTLQEVLRACCNRLRYVNKQGEQLGQPECAYSEEVLGHLREAIRLLEVRAARRHGRDSSEITQELAEFGSCCEKCNHVGCEGGCHV